MSDLRTAALRALNALSCLEYSFGGITEGPSDDTTEAAITALREALVEDAMQKFTDVNQEIEAALAEPQEPVQHEYEVTANDDGTFSVGLPDGEELRIIPPQRPAAPIIQPEIKDDKPFGYFRAEPFGWTDCAPTDEGAIPLYERPQGKL